MKIIKILLALLAVFTLAISFTACNNRNDENINNGGGSSGGKDHVHSFENWKESIPATCNTDGEEIGTCACGETFYRVIARLGHSYSVVSDRRDPTCAKYGYITYECANGCGQSIKDLIDSLPHSYADNKIEPTCSESGCIEHVCSECGYNYKTDFVAPYGHSFGEWQTVNATFESEGSRKRECGACGHVEKEKIDKLSVRATYTKEGEYDAVRIDRSIPGDADSYIITRDRSTDFEIVGEYVAPEELEIVYFGDNVIRVTFDGGSLREVHISADVEYISAKAFWVNEHLSKIYFEGDAPEIHAQALNLNGSGKASVYPTEDAKGFDGMLFGGCEIIRSWIKQEKLDTSSLSLAEYAALVSGYTDGLALEILDMFMDREQEVFLYIPFEPDINGYKEIKDFTLALTKGCKTEREKIDAIYDWIVQNIAYSDPACYYTSYEVFESKTAVCAGYTTLMHDMLCAVGIPSFYTRGATLFGCGLSVSDIFEHPDDFTTHAWLSIVTSDGVVSYYDPTWGVQSPEAYKNMTAAEVGEYAVTFEVDSMQLMVDGIDHNDFVTGIQFLKDGVIYPCYSGKLGAISMPENYNYWISFNYVTFTGDHYVIEGDQPIGTIYNNGFVANQWIGNAYFSLADGRVLPLYRVINYFTMQSKYYGETLNYDCDFIVYENGFAYVIDRMLNVARVALYVGDEENVTIPSSINGIPVLTISQEAFKNNNTVKRVVISEGITTFYEGSFEGCERLEYVYIPSTYDWGNGEIASHTVFERCYNLKAIEISEAHPHFTSYQGNLYNKDMTVLIKFAPANDIKVFVLPESVTEINARAFSYSQLETVILHSGVTKICDDAFWHSRIQYIEIPAGCEIGRYAFHYATGLRRVVFGDGITTIPEAAFSNCQSLVEIRLPSTLVTLDSFVFNCCTSLISIDLPEGLKTIGYGSFIDAALVSITLPSTLEAIHSDAFLGCESLFVVNNKSSLDIGFDDMAYGGVTAKVKKLNADPQSYSITITENGLVFYADENCVILVDFLGCEGDTLILPESFDGRSYSMVEKCFASFDFIGYYQQSMEILTWEDYAFHYGQSIKYLVIPKSVDLIPDYAFEGWANIECIYYGGSRETWESDRMFSRLPHPGDPENIPMNDELINPDVYFYSENKPTASGSFWHYVNGVPTAW